LKIQLKRKQQEYKQQTKAMFADKKLEMANAVGFSSTKDEEEETKLSESKPEMTTKEIPATTTSEEEAKDKTPSEEEKVNDDEATL
jgi:hypothetical protein